jgi:hypothetical protein
MAPTLLRNPGQAIQVMLRVNTSWRTALATGLIALLVVVSVVPVATHARLFDDPYCDPHPATDSSGHRGAVVAPSSSEDAGEHCDICHWLRSLRVFDPVPAAALAPAAGLVAAQPEDCGSPDTRPAGSAAARAPPA